MTKEKRDWCKRHGICSRCGKNKARKNRTTCWDCAGRKNRQEAENRKWFVEHHICIQCRKNPAAPNRVRCDDCLEKESEYKQSHKQDNNRIRETAKNLRENYLYDKMCSKCGKKQTYGGTKYCVECLLKSRRNSRQYKNEHKSANNGCFWCGAERYGNKKYCLNCYKKIVKQLDDIRPMANKDRLKKSINSTYRLREAKKNGLEKH